MDPLSLTAVITQLINNVMSASKSAVELAKDSSDPELQGKLSEMLKASNTLMIETQSLINENTALRSEINALKAQHSDKITLRPVPPFGYLYRSDESDPLCPKCYQKDGSTAYMGPLQSWNGGQRRVCRICSWSNYEVPPGTANRSSPKQVKPYWE